MISGFFQSVKVVDPIGFEEINQKNSRTEDPCDGIGPGDSGQFIDKSHCNSDVSDANYAPADQHGEHGDRGFSCAAHDCSHTVGESSQTVKQADGLHMPHTEFNGHRGVAEQTDELGRTEVRQQTNDLSQCAAADDAKPHAFFDTAVLVST